MDTIKILGSLLRNNAIGSDVGGNILGSLLGGGGKNSQAADILGTLLGGSKRTGGGGGKGMGALGAILAAAAASQLRGKGENDSPLDMIGDLLGGGRKSSGGGIGDMIGGILGGGGSSGGGLLGSLLPGGEKPGGQMSRLLGASATGGASGSELLGMVIGAGEKAEPPQEAQDEADILIEAMCNAAKVDGRIDDGEREAILGKLGDLDEDEIAYLRDQLMSPVDLPSFVERVPEDMREQVYAFSLMAIKLDDRREVEYFSHLARGLELSEDRCNEIHTRLGQPQIFV